LAAVVSLSTASCAPGLMKLPSGPGEPAPDGRVALAEATAACQPIANFSAELGASGSVSGQRIRGRLLVGLAAPASMRLEAVAPFGPPVFIFVARADDATLLLPRDDRVLEHGRPGAVLGAVAGIPLEPGELLQALTGCVSASAGDAGRQLGDDWRVVSAGSADAYLHRESRAAPWRIVAVVHHDARAPGGPAEWRAEYRDFQNGVPLGVRLASADRKQFDLRLALSQVETRPLGPDVFRVQVPPTARPITLDELRHARAGIRQD
jgi:hypothetical protein